MTATRARIEELVIQVQDAFLDDPTLRLSLRMAQERFGLDSPTCTGVLRALVEAHVLSERDGTYRRYFPHVPRRAA